MLCDYHVHSAYSSDSGFPARDAVELAIRLGLRELCFTDHVDYFSDDETQHVDYPEYLAGLAALQQAYEGRLTIRRGVELGVQRHTLPRYFQDHETYGGELDFALLSVHEIDDLEFHNGEFLEGRDRLSINRDYYAYLLEMIELFPHYSVLAHVDVIKRYDPEGPLADSEVEDLVRAILKRAVQDGKGIEVNTSCFRYGLKDLTPSRHILKLFKELGGDIVTIGSDTHKPEHLAKGINEAKAALRELGFRYFCTFEGMQPHHHTL